MGLHKRETLQGYVCVCVYIYKKVRLQTQITLRTREQPRACHVAYSLWIIMYYLEWITQHSVLFRENTHSIRCYSEWITLNAVLFTPNNTWLFRVNMSGGALLAVLTFTMKFEFAVELSSKLIVIMCEDLIKVPWVRSGVSFITPSTTSKQLHFW